MFFIIYKLSEGNETHAFFNEKIRIMKNVISAPRTIKKMNNNRCKGLKLVFGLIHLNSPFP